MAKKKAIQKSKASPSAKPKAKKPEPKKQSKPVKKSIPTKKEVKKAPAKKSSVTKKTTLENKKTAQKQKVAPAKKRKIKKNVQAKSQKGVKPITTKKKIGNKKVITGKKTTQQKKKTTQEKLPKKKLTDLQKVKKYLLAKYKKRANIQNDKDVTKTAKELLKWIKKNRKLKDKNITHAVLQVALDKFYPKEERKYGRKTIPEIPLYLQQPNEYWSIPQVLDEMKNGVFKRVWIYSPLILGKVNNGYVYLSPTITYTYEETFKEWVDWINEQIRDGVFAEGSPPDIYFMFLDVFFNKKRDRWEIKIIPCDSEGNTLNTGFVIDETEDTDQTEDKYGVTLEEMEGKEVPEEAVQPEAPKPQITEEAPEVTKAKIKTEEEKQKSYKLQNLIQVKQSLMEDIKFNKEIGEPIDELLTKLKKIREDIDKLV